MQGGRQSGPSGHHNPNEANRQVQYFHTSAHTRPSLQRSPQKRSPQKSSRQYYQAEPPPQQAAQQTAQQAPQQAPQHVPQQVLQYYQVELPPQRLVQHYQPELPSQLYRAPLDEANAVIDAMCSLVPQQSQNMDWLLDLEFGPPFTRPQHRHVAYFDVQKRTVMSASQPNTVHPDYLKCTELFKDMIVDQYGRRELHILATHPQTILQHRPPPPRHLVQGPGSIPLEYQHLYRMMEAQKNMQNALHVASMSRQNIHRP